MSHTSVIQNIQTLIKIDTSNKKGVDEAMDWLTKWCKEQALAVQTFPGTRAMLIQTQPGHDRHLNFLTHIDVVPAEGWKEAFSPQIKDEFLYGRGSVDDKGPLAICLEVLRQNKNNTKLNVSCLVITDEEVVNEEIGTILQSKKFSPAVCIVADGGTHQLMDIGQKGIVRCEITMTTAGGHSAFEEREKSASLRLMDILQQLNRLGQQQAAEKPFSPTFINLSKFVSEAVPYGLPEKAVAHIEIQFPTPQTSTFWREKLAQLENDQCQIHVSWTSEPHLLTDEKVLHLLHQLPEMQFVTTGGNNLAKDVCLAGIPAVSHCPVAEYIAHCPDEKIALSDLDQGLAFYQRLVMIFEQAKNL